MKIGEMSGAHSNERGMIAAYPQLHGQDDKKFRHFFCSQKVL